MFQDEARFGRMARIRRCWAPAPLRPMVRNGYERQFTYVYGAVSPLQGQLDWSLSPNMNTERMNDFLLQVSQSHPNEFIVMVLDGASSHKAKELVVPEHIRLLSLPGYSPELNPEEHIWDELREKVFPNAVLDHMDLVVERLKEGMNTLASDARRIQSITAWPWIVNLNLTANWNKMVTQMVLLRSNPLQYRHYKIAFIRSTQGSSEMSRLRKILLNFGAISRSELLQAPPIFPLDLPVMIFYYPNQQEVEGQKALQLSPQLIRFGS